MNAVSMRRPGRGTRTSSPVLEWLGWHRPILHSTVDYLLKRYRRDRFWDMDSVVCVLPSSLAGRRLTSLLAEIAQRESFILRPPEVITSGRLPELLYQARFPFASDLEQILCWTKVLRRMPSEILKPLLIEVPSSNVSAPWIELATMLSALHRELSSDLTMFDNVAKMLSDEAVSEVEVERWNVLAKVQRAYLDELHRAKLWDIQTARRYAIDKQESNTNKDIIVIGAVDLNRAQRSFLEAIHARVTILIGAPETWKEGFDEFGTLRSGFWQELPVQLESQQLVTRATADEAAMEVARQLAYLGSRYTAQEITLGTPDTTLVPILTEHLQRAGVVVRNAAAVVASQSSPVKLLRAIVEYVEEGGYEALAALVRVPIVFEYLVQQPDIQANFLQELDSYYEKTLIRSVQITDWPVANGLESVRRVIDRINQLVQPIRSPSMSLPQWSKPIEEILQSLFQSTIVDLDLQVGSGLADACGLVSQAITQLSDLPGTLTLESTLKEAVEWIVRQIDRETIPPLRDPDSLELLGWLDLSLDDAPVLLLTGVYDGTVPESVNSDAFLPNKIRTRLGLMDNSRRYARDCYTLHVVLRSRRHLRIITNHMNVNGEPQTPSRLLLAVPPEELAKRVMTLIHPSSSENLPKVAGSIQPRPIQSDLPIPMPIPKAGQYIQSMSPTDFRTYIECPYRFYLSKILKLSAIDDRKTELEANDFGNLLHDTLEKLKDEKFSVCTDVTQLRVWLFGQFNELALKRFGRQPPSVVLVQLEQARQRLAAFAVLQARRASEGWTIWGTEIEIEKDKNVVIELDGQPPMPIIGRIDRIDFHPGYKQYAIWDYKTGDTPVKPEVAHWTQASGWKQLQLPLYRYLAPALGIKTLPLLGYINLPRATEKVAFVPAEFSDDRYATAIDKAREIVQRIQGNEFWPPRYDNCADWDTFAGICQNNMARRWEERFEADVAIEIQNSKPDEPPESQNEPPEVSKQDEKIVDRPSDSMAVVLDTTAGTAPDEWFDRTMIEASAGTGKTFSLAIRMIRLLFAKQSPEGILATTFTRKAAGEILERVLRLLAEAIESPSAMSLLSDQLKPLKINQRACVHHLSNLCANLHRLRVNTLDGFYSQLARAFAIELKLPPGWSLADEFQTAKLRRMAVTRMFENEDRSQLRTLISQLTRGEAKRNVRHEIDQAIDHGYGLFLMASKEAWSNVPMLAEPESSAITAALVQVEQLSIENKPFTAARDKLLDAFANSDWTGFLGLTMVTNSPTTGKFSSTTLPVEFLEGVKTLRQLALSKEWASRRAQTEAAYELLASFHLQYDAVKHIHRLITFSDVSQRLAEWFRNQAIESKQKKVASGSLLTANDERTSEAHLSNVGYRLDSRIDHLLLDEFQDTSPAQWDILSPFAEAIVQPSEGQTTSFFCVGDVKQAIYGWRGGRAELFDVVKSQLKGIKLASLTQSYRSSPIIIDFVNECFSQLPRHENFGSYRDAAHILSGAFPTHFTTKNALPGYVRIWNTSSNTQSPPETTATSSDDSEGVDAIPTESIDQCVRDVADIHRSAPEITIGILVRTNRELGPILHRLREAGVEASQEGGNPLDDSAAVELLLSLIEMADHPENQVAVFHLRHSPLAKLLGPADVAWTAPTTGSFAWNASAQTLATDVRRKLDELGYGRTLAQFANELMPHCNDRDQLRLDQLIQTAYRYDSMATLRSRDFVDFVRKNRIALNLPVAVRVMTIHQSKGLEFDAVFLPGLKKSFVDSTPTFVTRESDPTQPPQGIMRYVNEKLQMFLGDDWQGAYRQQAIRAFSEALSTFYVSVTRTRQALYLYAHPAGKPVQKWDSLLHSVFVPLDDRTKSDTIVYEKGDREWYRANKVNDNSSDAPTIEDSQKKIEPIIPPAIRIALKNRLDSDFVRQRTTVKPSATSESRTMPLKNIFERHESIGAIIGTLIHRWFEELVWLEDFQWDRDKMSSMALQTLTPQEMPLIRLPEWLSMMETYLGSQCVIETLSKQRYANWNATDGSPLDLQVTNERRLLEILDNSLLRGTIDRLVVGLHQGQVVRAEILDYKTDALSTSMSLDDWMHDRIEHHAPQLRLYRKVLGQQFQLDESKIATTLILLSGDRYVSFI